MSNLKTIDVMTFWFLILTQIPEVSSFFEFPTSKATYSTRENLRVKSNDFGCVTSTSLTRSFFRLYSISSNVNSPRQFNAPNAKWVQRKRENESDSVIFPTLTSQYSVADETSVENVKRTLRDLGVSDSGDETEAKLKLESFLDQCNTSKGNEKYRHIYFKIETTGLLHQNNDVSIYELAAVDSKTSTSFTKLCQIESQTEISEYSKNLLNARDITDEILSQQQPFEIVFKEFTSWLISLLDTDEIPVINAYNGRNFDFQILSLQLNRLSLYLPSTWKYADPYIHISGKLPPTPILPSQDTTSTTTSTSHTLTSSGYKLADVHRQLFGYNVERNFIALEDSNVLKHVCLELNQRNLLNMKEMILFSNETINIHFHPTYYYQPNKASSDSNSNSDSVASSTTMDNTNMKTKDMSVSSNNSNSNSNNNGDDRQSSAQVPTQKKFTQSNTTNVINTNINTNTNEKRIYLKVPFSEKDVAKSKGARFDWDSKKWYILEGTSTAGLEAFMP